MKKITIGKHAGFCWGVQRSYDKLLDAAAEGGDAIVTLGPLIHNPQTIERLRDEHGIDAIDDPAAEVGSRRVAVRTHGARPQVVDEMKARGVPVMDLTCPLVRVIQKRAEKLHRLGYYVVIVGQAAHPEIISITGYVPDGAWVVVETIEGLANVTPGSRPIGVVCQSTHMVAKVEDVVAELRARHPDREVRFENTICFVTTERQEETKWMAETMDAILVIGGAASSNTEKLRKTALAFGATHVTKIEGAAQLDPATFDGCAHLGVLAGASTPSWLIDEIVATLAAYHGTPAAPVEIENLSRAPDKAAQNTALDAQYDSGP